MTATVQAVVAAAQRLSASEQLEVIQALTRVLQESYSSPSAQSSIWHAPLVTDLADFAAEFWPTNETADDINHYLAQQRAADRIADMSDTDL